VYRYPYGLSYAILAVCPGIMAYAILAAGYAILALTFFHNPAILAVYAIQYMSVCNTIHGVCNAIQGGKVYCLAYTSVLSGIQKRMKWITEAYAIQYRWCMQYDTTRCMQCDTVYAILYGSV